jgi:hypothetical protein
MSEKRNQGEGDREADARYREHASRFVREGKVADAADAAASAMDSNEGVALREAEREGKARAEGVDERFDDTAPMNRADTDDVLEWDQVRAAVRTGHEAALRWPEADRFEAIEGLLADEWAEHGIDVPWDAARDLVRRGWEQGRKDVEEHAGPPDAA